jgi:hypothetical protein
MRHPYPFPPSRRRACAALLLAAILAGCNSRPSAPALEDGPVYNDRREGFRFFVPEGWKQRARGTVPSGKIAGERMLVEYKCLTPATSAGLMVSVADVPESTSLSDYIAKNNLTREDWRLAAPAEDFTINGVPAARITYLQGAGKDQSVREIVAFRRGERVYFFKGFYASADAKSRKAVKATIETVVW